MGATGKQFFFVNKSENSIHLSKCLPQEKAVIQRYVQTGRKRHRSVKRTKLTTKTSGPFDWFQVASTIETISNETQSVTSNETDKSLESNENVQILNGSFALNSKTSLSKRDPFNAASVPINNSVASLLHYYMYYYHPSLWPNELILYRHGVYTFPNEVQKIMKTAITDRLAMYCLLSASACRVQFVDRLPCSLESGIESHYIREALRLMATYITTGSFEEETQLKQCLIYMIFLSSAEAYRGDLFAAKAHLAAAVRLLEPMGGLSSVKDDNLKGQLAMADLFLSCAHLEPCQFDCSYNPGPASTLHLITRELHVPCATSTASSLNTDLPPDLRVLIDELVESHTVKTRILTSAMQPKRAMQVMHWISLRNMSIRNRLLALRTVDYRIHALRVAMIMWSLLFNISGRIKTVKIMAPMLQSILISIPAYNWTKYEDVRLWIVLVGTYCAREGSDEWNWFMNECRNLCMGQNISLSAKISSDELAKRLENFQLQFFYDIPAQYAQTRSLAEKLQHLSP